MVAELADLPARRVLDLCLPALNDVTPLILSRVGHAVAHSSLPHLKDDVQIVLAEALNNIVEHAYKGGSFGAIALTVTLRDRHVHLCLTDWGHALPDNAVPRAQGPDPDTLSEGGYGWFLIHALTSEIRYARIARSNRLTLRFRG